MALSLAEKALLLLYGAPPRDRRNAVLAMFCLTRRNAAPIAW